jgi:endonuclease-3
VIVTPARLPVIIRFLDEEYWRPRWSPRFEPVEELVFTILSQNTTDVNAERCLASLRARFPTWEGVAAAPVEEIGEAIRGGGLWAYKSRYIKETLSGLLAEHGDLSLEFLDDMNDDEAVEYLTKFPGVGVKTAACVLMFSLGRPVMPVDTHVFRVCKRLDFLPEDADRVQAHRILNTIVPPEDKYSFHINLVTHGRKICIAGRPRCDRCVIEPLCPSSWLGIETQQ